MINSLVIKRNRELKKGSANQIGSLVEPDGSSETREGFFLFIF